MNKRGMQHVEVVLAFVMFIGFISAVLFLFNPINAVRSSNDLLYFTQEAIMKNITGEMITYSVKINNEGGQIGSGVVGVELNKLTGENEYVYNLSGDRLRSKKNGNKEIYILPNSSWVDPAEIIYIRVSREIEKTNSEGFSGNLQVNKSYYQLISPVKEEIVSEKKLLEINRTYYENNSKLRADLGIPRSSGFAFSIRYSNNVGEGIISEKDIPAGVEVFADTKRIKILKQSGETIFADMVIKVW